MRIAVDGRLLDFVHNTGISRYTEFLINYYILRYRAENISIITNDRSLRYNGCKTVYTRLKQYNISDFYKYRKFIKNNGFDILHVPFYSGLHKKISSTKIIVTVHDLMYRLVDCFFGKYYFTNKLKVLYFNHIIGKTLKASDIVITVSNTTKHDLFKFFGQKSIHIPEYSELQYAADSTIIDKHNLSKKGFFFYCGNNRPHKNIDFIRNVFINDDSLPPLVLAGKGHSTGKNVINVGVVTEEELKSLYTNAIAFIFPSKYEGFGLPVLESLHSSTHVIASNIPAFREFESENILYFDLGNKEQFKECLKSVQNLPFVDEPDFFYKYSVQNIHNLLNDCTDLLTN